MTSAEPVLKINIQTTVNTSMQETNYHTMNETHALIQKKTSELKELEKLRAQKQLEIIRLKQMMR